MRVDGKPDQVILTLSGVEVERLSAVLGEATLALSRAEFYIRTGCSAPNVLELVRQLAWWSEAPHMALNFHYCRAWKKTKKNPAKAALGTHCSANTGSECRTVTVPSRSITESPRLFVACDRCTTRSATACPYASARVAADVLT